MRGGARVWVFSALILAVPITAAGQERPGAGGPSEVDLSVKAVERANAHRRNAGLQPVALDTALSKGCKAHAEYLVRNAGAPQVQGLGAHNEDPGLPGHSEAGKKAGKSSDINYTDPVASVDGWMNSLFHRVPLLAPDLVRVGVGYARGGERGWVCVTVCLFPKDPLEPGRTYVATVEAKLGARPWKLTWSFTTAKPDAAAPQDPAKGR